MAKEGGKLSCIKSMLDRGSLVVLHQVMVLKL